MAKSFLIAIGVAIFALITTLYAAKNNHWPNFSCYTPNSSVAQGRAFLYNRMGWRSCNESYHKYKGNCAQVCVLLADDILVRQEIGKPVVFDIDAFIKFFADELGYSIKGVVGPEQERMAKVRAEMETSKAKYPEYEGVKNLRKTPCEPLQNFLQCFDKSIGCKSE